MMRHVFLLVGALVVFTISTPSVSSAAPFGVTIRGSVDFCLPAIFISGCPVQADFSKEDPSLALDGLTRSWGVPENGLDGLADTLADAGLGRLGAAASFQGGALVSGMSFNMRAQSEVHWFDTVTITGAMPPGTPVTLAMSASFGGSSLANFILVPPNVLLTDCFIAQAGFGGSVYANEAGGGRQIKSLDYSEDACMSSFTQSGLRKQKVIFDALVGQDLEIGGALGVGVDGNAGTTGTGAWPGTVTFTKGIVNASHTLVFNLDVVTPGASYVTASGATYFTPAAPPVPAVAEPASVLLVLSGLAAFARMRFSPRTPRSLPK